MLLKAYINRLYDTPLFHGIKRSDFEPLLSCLSAQTVYYKKGEAMIKQGDAVCDISVLLSGEAKIFHKFRSLCYGIADNENVQPVIAEGDIFGEVLACVSTVDSPISVIATQNSAVMLLNYDKIMTPCQCLQDTDVSIAQMQLVNNLMRIIGRSKLLDERKLETLQKRSIRERLLTFLDIQREMAESDTFVIPYNREELSDYLCVDRSALSRELCKLSSEGIISFKKNVFMLKSRAYSQDEKAIENF